MASGNSDNLYPLKNWSCTEFLPPDMSELRVVLLGNSWSQRSLVGNCLLGNSVFSKSPQQTIRISGPLEKRKVVVVNTGDLLKPYISHQELNQQIVDIAHASAEGPHVFLLVLEPEDFTEENNVKLCRILETFNARSFDHSLVLVSTPREKSPALVKNYMEHRPLKDMIRKCQYRYLTQKNIELPELLTRLSQVVKENNGKHVSYKPFEDTTCTLPADQQRPKETLTFDLRAPKAKALGFRIMLLGKSDDKQTRLKHFIREQSLHSKKLPSITARVSQDTGKPVTVVKTQNIFNLHVSSVRKELASWVSLCPPGPHVLLLLVKPSEFDDENRQTLKFILSLFGPKAFKHSMVILTHEEEMTTSVNELLKDCGGRHSMMPELDYDTFMKEIQMIVQENRGSFLTLAEETEGLKSEHMKPALNLVLFGRGGTGKTSAAMAILGETDLHSVCDSFQCDNHQGEVRGHWVSIVELPALYGKPQEVVMRESLRCISLCYPEGVHAFILVLPLGPLREEDRKEIKTFQDTFSSRVNDYSMILFNVSDPSTPDFNISGETKEIQDLCRRCGGRYVVLNVKEKQQIPKLLDMVENISQSKSHCYTTGTFLQAQIETVNKQQEELQKLKNPITCDEEEQGSACLRIVLIGKTGSGKSSTGNTILGRKQFKAQSHQNSVTKRCQKEHGEVNSRTVVVVDTPGLFDNSLSHEEVNEEMIKCVSLLAPGPHAFLLVLKIGRLTPEEKETLRLIKESFGRNAEKFTIILLTGGDSLEDDDISIKEFIENNCDDSFKKLISDCGGRYHVFNNRDKQNQRQVSELMTKIDAMVRKNGGNCYTNEMLQEAEAAIIKEMEKILKEKEEEMQREREQLQRKHEEEMEEMKRRMEKQREEIKNERKLREKQLDEMKKKIDKEREDRKKEQEMREEENERRKHQDEKQHQEWKEKLLALEQKIKSESEERESINRKLQESREELRQERENEEKKQKEWWEKRNQEDEQRRQEEQTKLRQLQKEYEQERENYEKKRKEEDRIRKEQEEKQKKEIENERQHRDKQLKEMKENMDKEREQRKKEQQIREEEIKKRKQEEENQRQEWKQKHEAMEEKIKSESKEKENIDRKLQESREEMRKEREEWEKRQNEWWDQRYLQDEQREQEEQEKFRKLTEKYEQEKEKYEKKKEEDDQIRKEQEMERRRVEEKQRAEIEKERREKMKELKEMEEKINKEREKEQEMREEENRTRKELEEVKKQEWQQKVEALEQKIKSESEEKNDIDRKLRESREQMRKEREDWEKKQSEWWEKRKQEDEQRRQEERKLQEEYEREKENSERKRKEEDRIRKEQEEKQKKQLEEDHAREKVNLKKTYEDEARKKAEEFNDFKVKESKKFEVQKQEHEKLIKDKDQKYDILKAMADKQQSDIHDIVKCVTKNRQNLKRISDLLKKHEKEMKKVDTEEDKTQLQQEHDKQRSDLIRELVNEADKSSCVIL